MIREFGERLKVFEEKNCWEKDLIAILVKFATNS